MKFCGIVFALLVGVSSVAVAHQGAFHTVDLNENNVVELSPELMRVIQLYNAGGYCPTFVLTEDGYIPSTACADGLEHAVKGSVFHDADLNRNWKIELSELLRVLQFHNVGGYCESQLPTEDGFVASMYPCPDIVEGEGQVDGEGTTDGEGSFEGFEGEGSADGEGTEEAEAIEGEGVSEGSSEGLEGETEGSFEGNTDGEAEAEAQEGEGTLDGEAEIAEGEGSPEGNSEGLEGESDGEAEIPEGEGTQEGSVDGEGQLEGEGTPEGQTGGEGSTEGDPCENEDPSVSITFASANRVFQVGDVFEVQVSVRLPECGVEPWTLSCQGYDGDTLVTSAGEIVRRVPDDDSNGWSWDGNVTFTFRFDRLTTQAGQPLQFIAIDAEGTPTAAVRETVFVVPSSEGKGGGEGTL